MKNVTVKIQGVWGRSTHKIEGTVNLGRIPRNVKVPFQDKWFPNSNLDESPPNPISDWGDSFCAHLDEKNGLEIDFTLEGT